MELLSIDPTLRRHCRWRGLPTGRFLHSAGEAAKRVIRYCLSKLCPPVQSNSDTMTALKLFGQTLIMRQEQGSILRRMKHLAEPKVPRHHHSVDGWRLRLKEREREFEEASRYTLSAPQEPTMLLEVVLEQYRQRCFSGLPSGLFDCRALSGAGIYEAYRATCNCLRFR